MKAKRTVLCVEAEVISGMVRRLVLNSFGYAVVETRDACDAAALLRAREIDAVVLASDDAGVAAAVRTMRGASEEVPIVVIQNTPFVESELRREIRCVLTKGERPERLRAALKSALDYTGLKSCAVLAAFAAGFLSVPASALICAVGRRGSQRPDTRADAKRRRSAGRGLGVTAAGSLHPLGSACLN